MTNPLRNAHHPPLPGPFATPPSPDGVVASPAVSRLVHAQVRALLESSPAFHQLPAERQRAMRGDLEKIATYEAALIHDEWASSEKLGQTPVLKETVTTAAEAPAQALAGKEQKGPAADEFSPRAASQVARITKETLNAIAFPTFMADLIKGTFQAIVNASIQQMEAYANLLSNVAKTVDQFMADNVSDNNARDYLAQSYPGHFKIEADDGGARLKVRDGADDRAKPDFKSTFKLNEDVDLDDEAAEKTLVPAARRHLAQSRHSLLSTMVLMGINRIVITSGRIAAKMGFRIDAKDHGSAQSASQFDFKNETTMSAGGGLFSFFGGPSVESKSTVAYVSSTKKDSSDELDVHADLTGEVDLKFKSDYFPMERFAKPEMLALIQGHTPNPTANNPSTAATPGGASKETA
jgi:hypothetical protein